MTTKTLAHYHLGHGGVTGAAGPDTLAGSADGAIPLEKHGDPRFVASAPAREASRGQGALEFRGGADCYTREEALEEHLEPLLLEVWTNASNAEAKHLRAVVANGDGARGHVLGQQNLRWVLHVGGRGFVDIGPVTIGRWTHLALVREGEQVRVFMDGAEQGRSLPSESLSPVFAIGGTGRGGEGFEGLIHEVRAATFKPGTFDVGRDFLLDYDRIREASREDEGRRRQTLQNLTQERHGVRIVDEVRTEPAPGDWLIERSEQPVELQVKTEREGESARLVLTNGLVSRSFWVGENLACFGMRNLANGAEFIRAVRPEARLRIDGRWLDVGGLTGQPEMSYLVEQWLPGMRGAPDSFRFAGLETRDPEPRYPWEPRFNAVETPWPPKGLRVDMRYEAPASLDAPHTQLRVTVHYEMYENLPVVAKWFTLHNESDEEVRVDQFESELLAVAQDQRERLHVESDYSFAMVNASPAGSGLLHFTQENVQFLGGSTTLWTSDEQYGSYATHNQAEDIFLNFPHRCLLHSRPPMGPAKRIEAGESFTSMITFELLQDADDRERQTLGHRRFYRMLAPQVTQHLLTASCPSTDPAVLKPLMDQMEELGFEQLDIAFWTDFRVDTEDPDEIAKWKDLADYARDRGIVSFGGYELMIASRDRGAEHNCVDPVTQRPGSFFGQSVCMASEWRDDYFRRVWSFLDQTGMNAVFVDGPYHGDVCAASNHKYHDGLEDSQWAQWEAQKEYFRTCLERGMATPAPDWYFLVGQEVTGMGYREASANLPRELALLLCRQYIYDGTWHKIPPMGGIGLHLVPVYVDDPRAILEPLEENLAWYARYMMQSLGAGASVGFRARRLYDSEKTKSVVQHWIDWFRRYREILTSDIIHLGRPTGRDIDCILHVNPELKTRGMLLVFNPLAQRVRREIRLPLYYTGLRGSARIREQEGEASTHALTADATTALTVELEPEGSSWFVIEPAE